MWLEEQKSVLTLENRLNCREEASFCDKPEVGWGEFLCGVISIEDYIYASGV